MSGQQPIPGVGDFPSVVRRWGVAMLNLLPSLNRTQRARLERELEALVKRARDGGYTFACNQPDLWDECSAEFLSAMTLAGEIAKEQRTKHTPPPDAPGLGGLRIKF